MLHKTILLAVALTAIVTETYAATYQWVGRGDGQVYSESNWTDIQSGAAAASNSINPNTAISHTLVVNGLTPGNSTGSSGQLLLGATGALEVNGGTFRLSGTNGISGGVLRVNGGAVYVNALAVSNSAYLSSGALELKAAVPWTTGVHVDFTAGSLATLRLNAVLPATVRSNYLSAISVEGAPAVEGTNVVITSDGASGTLISRYDANDTDADGLPDDWEQLHFGNLAQNGAGDPDSDGLSNRVEFSTGTSPELADSDADGVVDGIGMLGALRREVWTAVNGNTVGNLTSATAFTGNPSQLSYIISGETPRDAAENYGQRLRGWIKAPVTGTYRFWVSGDEAAELWLGTTSSKFSRKLIASVPSATAPREWTRYSQQASAIVSLEANQEYYVEVLHKEATGVDSLAVAWEYTETATSTLTTRAIVPGSALRAWAPDSTDADDDYLLDTWEVAQGLNPASGVDGGYADTDGDGLNNLAEYESQGSPLEWGGNVGLCEWSMYALVNPTTKITALTKSEIFAQQPTSRGYYTSGIESPQNIANSFGLRMRGVITAPTSGTYYFYISANDSGELWLNKTGTSRFGKTRVAYTTNLTSYRQFTANASQKSVAIVLTAGQQIYFEALHVEQSASDHCSVGWLRPGQTTPEVVPASAVSTCVEELWQDPQTLVWYNDDTDDDSLPDHWERQFALAVTNTGTAALTNGEYGDYDTDNFSNFEEYQAGSDPKVINVNPGKTAREVWNNLSGSTLTSLRGVNGVLKTPDSAGEINGIEPPQNAGDAFGERIRGYLVASVTGEYTFWVAGDDQCELWLSTNEHKFYKRLIATIPATTATASYFTSFREWDKYYEQMSFPIKLEAGKKYFIEVLHKDNSGSDHVSVAWQPPGGTRAVIPPGVLESYNGEADDADGDYLPDSWETAKGLSATDNGKTNFGNGEYGDPDNDGLTNREEFLLRTNPLSADTDSDGFSDRDETRTFGSNPLINDIGAFIPITTKTGNSAVVSLGSWRSDATTGFIFNDSVRGAVDYAVTTTAPGFYSIDLDLGLQVTSVEGNYPLRISLDGKFLASINPSLVVGVSKKISILLPYISAGEHTISVQLDNARFGKTLIIRSVTLLRAKGIDADGDGLPDWAMQNANSRNNLVANNEVSMTSPAFVEGFGNADLVTISDEATVRHVPDQGWYADIHLPTDGSEKEVTFIFENGVKQISRSFSWAATNIALADTLRIRKGDSLRLTAFAGATAGEANVAIYVDDIPLPGSTENSPIVYKFDNEGIVPVKAKFTDLNGMPIERTLHVEVMAATFADSPGALVNQWRDWSNPQLDSRLHVDFDSTVMLMPPLVGTTGTTFRFMPTDLQTRHIVARLTPGGPILASQTMRVQELYSADQTLIREIEVYGDGTRLVEMKIAVNNLQQDTQVHLDIFAAGVVFQDTGLTKRTILASEFGDLGIATVYFIQAAGTNTATCHRLAIYNGNIVIGGITR